MDVPIFVVRKEDVKQRPSDRQDQNAQPRGATSPARTWDPGSYHEKIGFHHVWLVISTPLKNITLQ